MAQLPRSKWRPLRPRKSLARHVQPARRCPLAQDQISGHPLPISFVNQWLTPQQTPPSRTQLNTHQPRHKDTGRPAEAAHQTKPTPAETVMYAFHRRHSSQLNMTTLLPFA
jgi:hypothetical protein